MADLFADFPELEEVRGFSNWRKEWRSYHRGDTDLSGLLWPGKPYQIRVSRNVTVEGHRLTCRNGSCWNLVIWGMQ